MLASRRAAAFAHASLAQRLPLRHLISGLHRLIPERTRFNSISFPPPVCVAPGASSQPSALLNEEDFESDMGRGLDKATDGPAAKRQRTATNGAGGGQKDDPQKHQKGQSDGGKGKKAGRNPRIPMIHQAVKRNNIKVAMEVFHEAVAEETRLQTSILNSLMFLACGAEQWERYVRGLPPLSPAEVAAADAAKAAPEGGLAADGPDEPAESQKKRNKRAADPVVPPPEGPPPTREELVATMDELWSYMRTAGLQPDHGTYLALARYEALKGDPKAALERALECPRQGHHVQLRLFHPALVGYGMAGNVERLHHIDSLIADNKLDNTEYEYARLLEGIAAAGTYAQLRAVLLRMQLDLNELAPDTADYIAAFFEKNPAAQQAFAAEDQGGCPGLAAATAPTGSETSTTTRRWEVLPDVTVSDKGKCKEAGGTVRVVDLGEKDWEAFATAIGELARKNMGNRSAEFDGFVEWFERNGPYDVLVDAANVAFYGQNKEGGGFQWRQVMDMYEMLRQRFQGKKVLVMVHRKRLNDPEAKVNNVQNFLEKLRRNKSFYYTPAGANDDWFWLYACVRAKQNGLLVSNDELRDHIFSLLRPKHFLKWKERHIAHYEFAASTPAATYSAPLGKMFALRMPHPYTACVQQLSESGAWVVPRSDGTWMCVRPGRQA